MLFLPSIWFTAIVNFFTTVWRNKGKEEDVEEGVAVKQKKMAWSHLKTLMNIVFWVTISKFVIEQALLLNTTWHETTQERESKLKSWNNDCLSPLDAEIIDRCNQLKVVINTYPFIRAFNKVVNSWNSCITMPCTQAIKQVFAHIEYKLLLVCMVFALANYAYKFFGFTAKKAKSLKEKLQVRETNKRELQEALFNNTFLPHQFVQVQHHPLQSYSLPTKGSFPLHNPYLGKENNDVVQQQ